jgi:hypothetical protein
MDHAVGDAEIGLWAEITPFEGDRCLRPGIGVGNESAIGNVWRMTPLPSNRALQTDDPAAGTLV